MIRSDSSLVDDPLFTPFHALREVPAVVTLRVRFRSGWWTSYGRAPAGTPHDGEVSLDLRRVEDPPSDLASLQSVLLGAPDYALRVSGHPPSQGGAAEVLTGMPDGFDRLRKHVWLVIDGQEAIGCVDVLDGYPDPTVAWIGLFLLRETAQGRGWGGLAWDLTEHRISRWQHVRQIHLAVVGTNDLVRPFWESRGFTCTGAVSPYEHGDVVSTATVMSKQI